ncbi:Vacuolar ATPase subunit C [Operophtera brumata]|uniref:V-type proton ATPase subunit C n=1 Tax=Operophtera brumata TaxID=104452 RepID=A0A0L7LUG9_OPEBR|nr:Vacuolar ATPase subunit C [Operophtera brumata]
MIVPRSTQLIHQDNEYGLYTVTLFKKLHARERKFVVREFSYNEADLTAGKNEITRLVTDKKKQFNAEMAGLGFGSSDYFPYVFYKINVDMIEKAV